MGWRGADVVPRIHRMSPPRASGYTWDSERPKGHSSEWPSTGHSTLTSGFNSSRFSRGRRAKRRRPSLVRKLFLPFLLLLLLSGMAVLGLTRLIHG